MSLFAPRLCKDCRYAARITAPSDAWPCVHESSIVVPGQDLVTGEIPGPSRLSCSNARNSPLAGRCGAAGRFFVAAPTPEAERP